MIKRKNRRQTRWWRLCSPVIVGIAVVATVGCAGTAPITGSDGKPIPGSIAVREHVHVNGRDQGVVIRGNDRTAPVVLWLAGGPGGSETGWIRSSLGALERDVVLVNWDQPGVGMSFSAADWDTVTVADFVDDTIAMSEYLRDRFHQDRIILVGHSWGSVIGLMAADRRPDLYSAYVGVAQQVNARENDRHGYDLALSAAAARGDRRVVRHLTEIGPPPYSPERGRDYLYLFQKVHVYSPHPAPEPSFAALLFPREYTLLDSIHVLQGLLKGVSRVYPQLNDLDFERTIPSVNVPVFFFTGRYDETCVQNITYRYDKALKAPHKEFVWFEQSGHNVPYQQPERLVREFRDRVLTRKSL